MAAPGEVQPAQARCGSADLALDADGRADAGREDRHARAGPDAFEGARPERRSTGLDSRGFSTCNWISCRMRPPRPCRLHRPILFIAGSSIPQALRQQLGLQLESTKGPVEVIVIDHVEKPSEN